ncbi:MAG: polysaccharide deacetylase family protein [Allorhizobium sp.]
MLKGRTKRAIIANGLNAAWLLSRAGAMGAARGRGAIFTLHHVRPFQAHAANPNRHLEVTPEFLDTAIRQLKHDGYRFAAVADLPALLADTTDPRPFATFTLDDGYDNNAAHALPVFERHGVPFTVFVCKGFSERSHTIWWETADALVNARNAIELDFGTGPRRLKTGTPAEKIAAFCAISDAVFSTDEADAIAGLDRTALAAGVDPRALTADLVMDESALRKLCGHPLATLGAHTVSHRALSALGDSDVADEMRMSADYVETIVGERPQVLAYPYGDQRSVCARTERIAKEQGFAMVVTTAPGTLGNVDRDRLWSLPRISLNGYYQSRRAVSALASGIPFTLMRR